MTLRQVSVFLENSPGHLDRALAVLAEAKLNIVTLTIADSSNFGILRMIVSDPVHAVKALREAGFTCKETRVVAIEVSDHPGALHAVLKTCSACDLNIEYMYAFTEKRAGRGLMVFRFDNTDAAQTLLEKSDYLLAGEDDILES